MNILKRIAKRLRPDRVRVSVIGGLLACAPLASVMAVPTNITVIGVDNSVSPPTETPITNYRWLVEEDRTYKVQLDESGEVVLDGDNAPVVDPNWQQDQTLSVSFHQSYMPVVDSGNQLDVPDLDNDKSYFISVLPDAGHSLGGAQLHVIPENQNSRDVTVYVNTNPIPTARIVVRVHEDIEPINGVWDQGEQGLENFKVILEDAGGRYGASAGVQLLDVYGNPLCTTYTAPGVVDVMGSGCYSDADGFVTIDNLAPGKYGVIISPPNAEPDQSLPGTFTSSNWIQTSTIEGSRIIDAWVKANEPTYFAEFGPPGPHVSFGFVPAGKDNPYIDGSVLTGGTTISGRVVNQHLPRPPETAFYNGAPFPHTTPWVGLNQGAAGQGRAVYAAHTDEGAFDIPNVPPGAYQLVVWDDALDIVIAYHSIIVNADGTTCNALTSCNLGDVPVNQWFTRLENHVFFDQNEDGFRDEGEAPLLEQAVNLRWRDGSVYQSMPTDGEGFVPFDQVFPFFSWIVAEVDFARFKATGATITVDDGGVIDFNEPWAWEGMLNPQIQGSPFSPESMINLSSGETDLFRTEVGPVLTQAFQGFLGQTSVIEWGKAPYGPGENGGISGVVFYSVTRAEDDPRYGGPEPWEPGIPHVRVNLLDENGVVLDSTLTDSWDDSLPSDCQFGSVGEAYIFRDEPTDCFDGMRNWNQVRPGTFDGGFAFGPEFDCSEYDCDGTDSSWLNVTERDQGGEPVTAYLKSGRYHVEVVAEQGTSFEPNGPYQVVRSQDRNVDFGEEYTLPQLLPPECVGTPYTVPAELSLFPGVEAPLEGAQLQGCEKKSVLVTSGANAAADFFLYTEVPVAAHIIGFILDDAANEFDPTSPQFGEKYAPPFLPVSIKDWTGREIARTYSDEFGRYNALVPSTFTQYLGQPSGISPNMLTTCMNAKTKADGSIDPLHNPKYSQFCYTFQYMPGTTTYLDTPVVPVAAFAGPDQNPLDCALTEATPRIHSVSVPANGVNGGPYVAAAGGTEVVEIRSMGSTVVPNPAYDGVGGVEPKSIARDYGFGFVPGTVTVGGIPLAISSWNDDLIEATVPAGVETGQLMVTRGDNGVVTQTGITFQVDLRRRGSVINVADYASIQEAIDVADRRDLVLVPPGTYNEMVIMWKPVQLQGWGEGSTFIDAIKTPAEKLQAWRKKADELVNIDEEVALLPGQANGFGGLEPNALFREEGAGVLVIANNRGRNNFRSRLNRGARIDGFTISGADTGGGVVLNGYVDYMDVSNNRIANNTGFYGGGIRSGHTAILVERGNRVEPINASNDYVKIHHNQVVENGGLAIAGGGVTIGTGSDDYEVTNNFICGNFSSGHGGGIAHYGRSDNGLIADNTVIFNENFAQGVTVNGGGILIAGAPAQGCAAGDTACENNRFTNLSQGSGNVSILRNLIQGNSSGAGDGAGIRTTRVNGQDIMRTNRRHTDPEDWNHIEIENNIIVNNVSALSGAGISLQDTLRATIVNNTIANNDNASVASETFTPGIPSQSNPQPGAAIVSRAHSISLQHFVPATEDDFSNPILTDNIVWQNRQFFWKTKDDGSGSGLCPDLGGVGIDCGIPATPVYDDLAVIGAVGSLNCVDCLMTGGADPMFVAEYQNGSRETTVFLPETTTAITAPPALDEGGNFIRLRYGPLTQTDTTTGDLFGDYHITPGSPAIDQGGSNTVDDFDSDLRPVGLANDIGADELL